MAQNMQLWEFEEHYMKQVPIQDRTKAKITLEAMKKILSVGKADEKDLKDWNKAINSIKNKKIN